jgi:hypothetical protein
LRYLFSRIFNKDYCEKPTLLINILDFDKVKHLLPKDYNSLKSYSHMHFDAHIYLNFIFNGKSYSLSVAGEYWDREHTSPEEYVDRFKNRTPRLGNLFEDYLHLKSSDNFKKELKNRKITDILIIIDHSLNRDDFQDFIIEEFESQFKEIFNEPNFNLRNFPRYDWRDLKSINRNRQIFGDIKRFI